MSPLRVAHVSDCYPPRVGGIETQVHDLAVRQARAGHDVHVLTATGAAAAGVGHPGVGGRGAPGGPGTPTVHRLATPLTLGVPVHPLEGPLLRRALRALRPDVVHVHAGVVSPFAFAGARAARRLGVPLAITWHCMLDGVVPLYRAGAALSGWRRAAVALSAVSAVAGERVARVLAVDPADVLVVPNGLDVAAWADPSPPGAPLPPAGPLRVVATQRLAPRKRPVPLVRLVAEAHQRLGRDDAGRPRLHLTLIGSGPAEQAVRAEVARRGLGDVVDVVGRVPREELAGRYRGEHVFLAPARLEAFGIAALEARAAGLAVVAGRGTGVSEFVRDGVDGLLTPDRADGLDDGDADAALAAALVRLAREDGLLAGLLDHNRRVAPAADWADVLGAADALYARARARR
ncbi:glycosyltransferase family 4 protein [Georgenia thermotolerans]|uniref:D-inositol 3-phosphate glycosyltransferase n=1 Tax=Georgenia thermotolerans TaxID=527326 RepID=A0A7J5UKQ8_9MICO|nr:glycosyltransferase family 4 protein [Georgenia thermotolerans]KAE8762969.1 glycosyltransferase [Georgenia thermotolerans]